MKRASLAFLVCVAATGAFALAGCGGASSTSEPTGPTVPPATAPTTTTVPTTTTTPPRIELSVYFLRDGKIAAARRSVPETQAVATAALQELLAGPNGTDRAAGLSTAIPGGTSFHDLEVTGGVASLSLDGDLSHEAEGEVVYTLTQFSSVRSVALAGQSLTRASFEEVTPAILVESPAPGGTITSPLRVSGTANTFEATFLLKLTDVAGNQAFKQVVTATSGSGTRGTFDVSIPFEASPGPAQLVAYETSAENGQPIHVVVIPVEVAR